MKENTYPLIYIEWCDAMTYHDGWHDIDFAIGWADDDEWIVKQSGFLLKETPKYILIASQYNPQIGTNDNYSELHKIPKTWIRKRRILIK